MNQQTYQTATESLMETARQIETAKRPAYTASNADVLHNFKEAARVCGMRPMQAWGVLYHKHHSAIMSFVADPDIPQAEALEGRFADAINYLKLGYALMIDSLQSLQGDGCNTSEAQGTVPGSQTLCDPKHMLLESMFELLKNYSVVHRPERSVE